MLQKDATVQDFYGPAQHFRSQSRTTQNTVKCVDETRLLLNHFDDVLILHVEFLRRHRRIDVFPLEPVVGRRRSPTDLRRGTRAHDKDLALSAKGGTHVKRTAVREIAFFSQ